MRKLFITCDCGQQMQVPRSAIGKMGQCPSCGQRIPINRDTTSRAPQARPSIEGMTRNRWGGGARPSLDAKQRFGRAVDLYCAGHFGEALAIFDALKAEFPDSAEIDRARRQCIEARNRDPIQLPGPAGGPIAGDEFDGETIRALRRIAVEKMLHGSTDAVQIQAAELVARLAGVYNGPEQQDSDSATGAAAQRDAGSNGHARDRIHGGGADAPADQPDSRQAADEAPES
ncbi:MAG: hypothetical protein KF886_06675 [Candidatus Hydrogenedentes bacterium]|nr:hypothetical protein [Candidatus Hydrogenedentota bacterium]